MWPKWTRQLAPEKSGTIDAVNALHPPRKPNAGALGDFIDNGNADATNYSNLARSIPGAHNAGDKRIDSLYTADCKYGAQIYEHVFKGTLLESIVEEDVDKMRFSAIKYRIQATFLEADTQDDREAVLREKLTGQRRGMDSSAASLHIVYNDQLDQKKGWLSYHNEVKPIFDQHRTIAPHGHAAHITDASLKRPIVIKIKQMARYNKQVGLFQNVENAPTFLKAIMELVKWDLKEENQYSPDKRADAAYHAYIEQNGLDTFELFGNLDNHYFVNHINHEVNLTGNHSNVPRFGGKAGCFNCGDPKHRATDCKKSPGPHMVMRDGTAKKYRLCHHNRNNRGCEKGAADCPFIHIAIDKGSGGHGGGAASKADKQGVCTKSNCNRKTEARHHKFCDRCHGKRPKKSSKAPKPFGRQAGYTYEVIKNRDGSMSERRRKSDGKFAYKVELEEEASDDDDSSEDEAPANKRKKRKTGAGWSAFTPVAMITTLMMCYPMFGVAAHVHNDADDITTPIDPNAFGIWNAEPMVNNSLRCSTVNLNATNTYKITGNQFIAVDDSGASITGSTNCSRDFMPGTYTAYKTPITCKDAGGKRHLIYGHGNICINVDDKFTGTTTVTLHRMTYIPTFKSKLVGHNQLLREGANFHDLAARGTQPATSFWVFPDGKKITLRKRHGLNYWVGTINRKAVQPDYTKELEVNVNTADSIGMLRFLLHDTNIAGRPQKESLIRCRIAELGEYEPKSDPQKDNLVKLHARLGHPSPELTARYINENYTASEMNKLFGKPGRLFCETCALAKSRRKPRSTKPIAKENEFGMKTYMDISGRYTKNAVGTDYHYELIFVDSFTGYGTLRPLHALSQVTDAVRQHLRWIMQKRRLLGLTISKASAEGQPELLFTDGMLNADLGMRIHTDGANYFKSRDMEDMASEYNVDIEHAPMHSQWVNGVVERYMGTIHRRSAAMRLAAGLKHNVWYWSDQHAVTANNILPVTRHGGKSPYELVHKKKYDINKHHQTFGCAAYYKQPLHNKHADETVGRKGIYLGKTIKGNQHIVWFPTTSTTRSSVVYSNDVDFGNQDLSQQLLSGSVPLSTPGDEPFGDTAIDEGYTSADNDDAPIQEEAAELQETTSKRPRLMTNKHVPHRATVVGIMKEHKAQDKVVRFQPRSTSTSPPPSPPKPATTTTPLPLTRDTIETDTTTTSDDELYHIEKFLDVRGNKKHKQYLVKYAGYKEPEWQMQKSLLKDVASDDLKLLIKKFNAKRKEASQRRVNNATMDEDMDNNMDDTTRVDHNFDAIQDDYMQHVFFTIGKTYNSPMKAFADPQYGEAFEEASRLEHENARKRGLAVPILRSEVPKGEKIWNSTETFVLKANAEGGVERAKARLAFDGRNQKDEDISKSTVWSPKWTTVRWIFAFAAGMNWNVTSLDIPVAFGQVPPSRIRYMNYPYGTKAVDEYGRSVVLKIGNMYGSRDAGYEFAAGREGLAPWMHGLQFIQNEYDPALWYRAATTNEKEIHVVWYVDDAAIATADEHTARWFNTQVKKRWEMPGTSTKHGPCTMFLGMNVRQDKHGIKLSSTAYINNMIKELQADGTLPAVLPRPKTPLSVKTRLSREDCPGTPSAKSKYRTYAARINWLAVTTRPDLAYAAHTLAKVAHDPSEVHYEALWRVVCYAANTTHIGLQYKKQKPERLNQIVSSADSSDSDDPTTRKSTSGYVTMMNGSAIAWSSKTQTILTLSSCESEIVASCDAIRDILWIRYMTESQQRSQRNATPLGQDNASAIRIQENPWISQQSRSKHIHRRWLWQYDHILKGNIRLVKVKTTEMESDCMTKPLGHQSFVKLRAMFMSE